MNKPGNIRTLIRNLRAMEKESPPPFDGRTCLTVHQPWAWLIANGHKDIENRTRRTSFTGTLYIHAGVKWDEAGYQWVKEKMPHVPMPWKPDEFRQGGIIGSCRIVDVTFDAFGKNPWAKEGCCHWHLTDAKPLPFEKMTGQQGLFLAGNAKRVVEVPNGFTIKTTFFKPTGQYIATLTRAGVVIYTVARGTRSTATRAAATEAHRLNALPPPPAALISETCNCNEHHA